MAFHAQNVTMNSFICEIRSIELGCLFRFLLWAVDLPMFERQKYLSLGLRSKKIQRYEQDKQTQTWEQIDFDSERIFRPTAQRFFRRCNSYSYPLPDNKAQGLTLLFLLDNDFVVG